MRSAAYIDVLYVGLALRLCDHDSDLARGDAGCNLYVDCARSRYQSGAFQDVILRDANIRSGLGAHLERGGTSWEGASVVDGIGCRIHTIRHDGAVAKHVVGLPIIGGAGAGLVVAGMGIAHCQVTKEDDGGNGIVGVVHPDAVINASGRVVDVGHLTKGVGGTNAEIIVLIPIGFHRRADIGIGTFVLGDEHGFAEAGLAVAEVACQAAVTHGEEVFICVGKRIHLAFGQLRV